MVHTGGGGEYKHLDKKTFPLQGEYHFQEGNKGLGSGRSPEEPRTMYGHLIA